MRNALEMERVAHNASCAILFFAILVRKSFSTATPGNDSYRAVHPASLVFTPLDLSPWPESEAAIPTSHPGYSLFEYCQLVRRHPPGICT
jgi:hypothetical protein